MRLLTLCVAVAVSALACGGQPSSSAATAQKQYVIRWSVDNPPGSTRADAEQQFADRVAQKTAGRIKVQIFYSGSLGGGNQAAIDLVRAGGAEMASTSSSNLSPIDPTWGVFDLPFLFKGPDGLYAYFDSPAFADLRKQTEQKDGLVYIWDWYGDWRQLITTKKPVHSLGQVQGLKLRATGSPVETAYDQAFGAKPTNVDWQETYLAMKQGLVDGVMVSYTAITDFKMDDAVKYGITLNVAPILNPQFMNASFFHSLPADLQNDLLAAGRESDLAARQAAKKYVDDAIKKLQSEGAAIYVPSASELDGFRNAGQTIYPKFTAALPNGLVAKIQATQK